MAPLLSPPQFRDRLAQSGGQVLDVRTPSEYEDGHLAGAPNYDVMSPYFAERIADLPKDTPYYLYCRSGGRSGQAAAIMRQLGFDAYNVGGFDALAAAGFETQR